MTEVVVADCCPACKSEQVFEYEPGQWRLFIARTDNEISFCPKCGHRLAAFVDKPTPPHVDPGGHA